MLEELGVVLEEPVAEVSGLARSPVVPIAAAVRQGFFG